MTTVGMVANKERVSVATVGMVANKERVSVTSIRFCFFVVCSLFTEKKIVY